VRGFFYAAGVGVLSFDTLGLLHDPLPLIESDDARVQREGNWTLQNTAAAGGGSYFCMVVAAPTMRWRCILRGQGSMWDVWRTWRWGRPSATTARGQPAGRQAITSAVPSAATCRLARQAVHTKTNWSQCHQLPVLPHRFLTCLSLGTRKNALDE
jgi:hypothetical protein